MLRSSLKSGMMTLSDGPEAGCSATSRADDTPDTIDDVVLVLFVERGKERRREEAPGRGGCHGQFGTELPEVSSRVRQLVDGGEVKADTGAKRSQLGRERITVGRESLALYPHRIEMMRVRVRIRYGA